MVPSDKLRRYLADFHPDPQEAENLVRMVNEGRVKSLMPQPAAFSSPDNYQDGASDDTDDEDWYGHEKLQA